MASRSCLTGIGLCRVGQATGAEEREASSSSPEAEREVVSPEKPSEPGIKRRPCPLACEGDHALHTPAIDSIHTFVPEYRASAT